MLSLELEKSRLLSIKTQSGHEEKKLEKALMGKQVMTEMDWVLDSGCTKHMPKYMDVFLEGTYQ